MLSGKKKRAGFTLPELVVVLGLSIVVLALVYGLLRLSRRAISSTSAEVGGVVFPVSPSPEAGRGAMRVHSILSSKLVTSKCVYVFGGDHVGIPSSAAERDLKALRISALPTLNIAANGLPGSAFDFYAAHSVDLGPTDAGAGVEDFTVLVVGNEGGSLVATALVQVRNTPVTISDGAEEKSYVRRKTEVWTSDGDSAVSDFLEPVEYVSNVAVGARHYWFRYLSGRVREEGPTTVVFPDGYRYAGTSSADPYGVQAFPRWIYSMEVSP